MSSNLFIFLVVLGFCINCVTLQSYNLEKKFSDNFLSSEFFDEDDNIDCARVPPSLWCSCEKLSSYCGFTELCERYQKASRDKPIQLTFLYESLCPNCQDFFVDDFFNVYNQFKDVIHVELVPYGNAKRNNDSFECQHGTEECRINRYENCAIHFMPEPFPFIACLESGLRSKLQLEKAARKCYAKFHTLPHIFDQVIHCHKGDLGTRLQLQSAQRTESVWPDAHEHVPWVLFNNASIKNQQYLLRNLPTAICQMYVSGKNGAAPEACQGIGNLQQHHHHRHSNGSAKTPCLKNW